MSFGAGTLAARQFGARDVVDGREYAVGSIWDTYRENPHLKGEIPAMGYSSQQVAELETTINRAQAHTVIVATPIDLSRLIRVNLPTARVTYEVEEEGGGLTALLYQFERKFLSGSKEGRAAGPQTPVQMMVNRKAKLLFRTRRRMPEETGPAGSWTVCLP